MGAQASTNAATITNNLTTEAYQSCPKITATNVANITGVSFKPNAGCGSNSSFVIDQNNAISATCLLGSLQDTVAKSIAQMDAKTQGGLGFSASTNVANIENQLKDKISQSCASQTSSNEANVNNTDVTSCKFTIIQGATDKSSCQINNLQQMVSNAATAQAATTKGGSIFGDLFGTGSIGKWIIIIIVVILAIFILSSLGYYFYNRSQKPKQETNLHTEETEQSEEETSQTGGNIKSFFDNIRNGKGYTSLIFAIIILMILFVAFSPHNDQVLTQDDMSHLNESIKEARQIAGFGPKTTNYLSPLYEQPAPVDYYLNKIIPEQTMYNDKMMTDRYTFEDPFENNSYQPNNLDDFFKPLI